MCRPPSAAMVAQKESRQCANECTAPWLPKNPPANAGDARDVGLIPVSGRSAGERSGNTLQYPGLEKSMDRGPPWATIHGVAKNQT